MARPEQRHGGDAVSTPPPRKNPAFPPQSRAHGQALACNAATADFLDVRAGLSKGGQKGPRRTILCEGAYAGKIVIVPTTNFVLKWESDTIGQHKFDENLCEAEASGGAKNQLPRQIVKRLAEALEKSGVDIVPRIQFSTRGEGGKGAHGGPLGALIGILLSPKGHELIEPSPRGVTTDKNTAQDA
ncbi:hypothetical protein GTZ99_12665 [Novosphingobium sp. FSY-8]|uniref:Uncharacterized protein n=1 Tax=Novosphingobium ovatum TaxID=1908523 RepID=A0ABW9XFT7_9SPHN|nr:hypothetical protein [Novosphingobium ovatum]NBC37404.1 hypothetical protein [Novosphingobium ovatum]